ncbi:MAG: hypothetical protein ACFFFG_01800 [Candidatus Thorarchaeota archaeon]
MKLELIELIGGASFTTSRFKYKVGHISSSGRTEHSFNHGNAMKYIEDYCTKENFGIIDASGRKLSYSLFLYKD